MRIARGQRIKLDDHLDLSRNFDIKVTTIGKATYDTCCFGVDPSGKISDDRYTVFYNQTASPDSEITYSLQGADAVYSLNLSALPESVDKLILTVSIDGEGTMGEIQSHTIAVMQDSEVKFDISMSGSDFKDEKAIIGLEIYRKGIWRAAAVASGFNGGLGDILKSYGGEITEENTPSPVQAQTPQPNPAPTVESVPTSDTQVSSEEKFTNKLMGKISLSKDKVKLEKHVVNLSKCVVSLSKKSGVDIGNTRARVVVALDYSYSMESLFKDGTVQDTINRLVPLGLTFDDNGSIDFFLFETKFCKMTDLDLSNYENYVKDVIFASKYSMGGTNYAPVLSAVIEGTKKRFGKNLQPIVSENEPTFILFITDGENYDKAAADKIIKRSSELNVFIQFIGIGNSSFHYLEGLDNMTGRKRDNTGFSQMAELRTANDNELYTNVLEQFSLWLKGMQ